MNEDLNHVNSKKSRKKYKFCLSKQSGSSIGSFSLRSNASLVARRNGRGASAARKIPLYGGKEGELRYVAAAGWIITFVFSPFSIEDLSRVRC